MNFQNLVKYLISNPESPSFQTFQAKLDMFQTFKKTLLQGWKQPPTIVVAGTKGKGSVSTAIDSLLRESGLKTGLFTSPHLVSPTERIQINGKEISEENYVRYYREVSSVSSLPFFGLHTLMAALAFRLSNLDALVIEVGLGGRFDWTKLFVPSLCVITRLEYDHVEILGTTPSSIAWNKVGICLPGVPTFSTIQTPEFGLPMEQFVQAEGSKLTLVPPNWKHETGLLGPTAEENTSLAVASARHFLRENFSMTLNEREGAKKAFIQGRYQSFIDSKDYNWLLDGAHTLESLRNCHIWYKPQSSSHDVLLYTTTRQRSPDALFKIFEKENFRERIFVQNYSTFSPCTLR